MPNMVIHKHSHIPDSVKEFLKNSKYDAEIRENLFNKLKKSSEIPKAYRELVRKKVDRSIDLDKVKKLNQIRMRLNRLQEERSKLERFSESLPKEIRVIVDAILDLSHQLSGIQSGDSVILNTNKHVRKYLPLSKRGHKWVAGLSRNKASTAEPVHLNDLGFPMNHLEVEVAALIERARLGEQVFPPYNRREHENPLKYLEKNYGKYLRKFNGEADYLYQNQLNKIDPKFRQNLRMYLSNHGKDINAFVPNISKKVDDEAKLIVELGFNSKVFVNKIKNLTTTRGL